MRRKKKCIRVHDDDGDATDGEDDTMSDSQGNHDSDSMMGSPAPSSISEDLFSPHKPRAIKVDSPLVRHSPLNGASDMDVTLRPSTDAHSAFGSPLNFSLGNRYVPLEIPSVPSPVSSLRSDSSRAYSIDSLARSSVNSDAHSGREEPMEHNRSFDYALSPLSSPSDLNRHNSPRLQLSSFDEDINQNLSPKKKSATPGGVNSSFSISSLSVSAVTPSRVHCT